MAAGAASLTKSTVSGVAGYYVQTPVVKAQHFRWRPTIKCYSYQWKYFHRNGTATLGLLFAHCVSKKDDKKDRIEFLDSSCLSHEQMIQQACTATVNSASQLLTCTLVAIIDIGNKYSKALKNQMSLMEESIAQVGNENLQEDLTDLMTVARNNVEAFRRAFKELDSLMEYVEKLVNTATETSFLAGAETACEALSERLYSAKTKLEEQKRLLKELEKELVLLQKEVIKKTLEPNDNK